MTTDEVYSAVVKWIYDVTGVTTVRAHEGEARPALPYIMVNLIGRDPTNWSRGSVFAETGNTTPEGKAEITQGPSIEYEWDFSVHAYGENQDFVFHQLQAAQYVQSLAETIEPLVFFEISSVRIIPEMINAKWENRSNANLKFRGVVTDAFIVETIEETTPTEFNT